LETKLNKINKNWN